MFYLYAVPKGTLARQLEIFRGVCKRNFGSNVAHDFPIHCTLTKHFEVEPELVEDYRDAIVRHFAGEEKPQVGNLVHVAEKQLVLLELLAPKLSQATLSWVDELNRPDIQVVTSGFHVTIAYETRYHARIFELAQDVIHKSMDVSWEVCLCERIGESPSSEWRVPEGLRLC